MISIQTTGLCDVSPYMRDDIPLLLTNEHEVLEAPTIWLSAVSLRKSRSADTLKQYSSVITRFLQWLDDSGYQAVNWQSVDEDVIWQYVTELVHGRDELGRPNDKSIEFYAARLQDFYKWAKRNGYKHYWDMRVEEVCKVLHDQSLLKTTLHNEAKEIKLSSGQVTAISSEVSKYLSKESLKPVMSEMDDIVYKVITLIIWMTALRPKDLFQLPFVGTGMNKGIKRYRYSELDNLKDIYYEFESKGKRRSIEIPAVLWQFICKAYMPERQKRALIYREKHGVNPPNSVLFISKDGVIVTRKMLADNLKKAHKKAGIHERKLTAGMLRHSFATYFVLEALKKKNMLGKPYVYDAVIDDELRRWMGHSNIGTTYQYYVHLVNAAVTDDLVYDLRKSDFKELLSEIRSAKIDESS